MMANIIYSGITGREYGGERAKVSDNTDIYVSSVNGDNNNDGSKENPVKTLPYAFVLLRKNGGTIHMMDSQTIPAVNRIMPRNYEKITIVGEEGAVLRFEGSLYLYGDVDFDNIEILATKDDLAIYCNSHTVSTSDTVRWTTSENVSTGVQVHETTNVKLEGLD